MERSIFLLILVLIMSNAYIHGENPPYEEFKNSRLLAKPPQTSDLGKYFESNMNLSKGLPEIRIPLHQVNMLDYTLPIELIYDASGVKVKDIASAVGLKWSLSAGGSVSRNIAGKADESYPHGILYNEQYLHLQCKTEDQKEEIYNGVLDIMPDLFTVNCNGINSEFFLRQNNQIKKIGIDPIKISYNLNNNNIEQFFIFDASGNKYIFKDYYEESFLTADAPPPSYTDGGRTTWMLRYIITPINDTMKFSYREYSYSLYNNDVLSYTYEILECPSQGQVFSNSYFIRKEDSSTYRTYLIDTIQTNNEIVSFSYSKNDLLSVYKMKLDSIIVTYLLPNNEKKQIKTISFDFGFFDGDQRLKLNRLKISAPYASELDEKYEFIYNPLPLEPRNSSKKDIFGYHNNNHTNHLIPVSPQNLLYFNLPGGPANRQVDHNKILTGILTAIIYPTNGKKEFYYEPNHELIAGKHLYAPGVRVREVSLFSLQKNELLQKTAYTYSGLTGYSIFTNEEYSSYFAVTYANNEDAYTTYYWTSNPIELGMPNFNLLQGYYYEQVKVEMLSDFDNQGGRIYKYTGIESGFSIKSYLTNDIIYKLQENNTIIDTVQHTQYNYQYVFDVPQNISGFVLGRIRRKKVIPVCNTNTNIHSNDCIPLIFYENINHYPIYTGFDKILVEKLVKVFPTQNETEIRRFKEHYAYNNKLILTALRKYDIASDGTILFGEGEINFYPNDIPEPLAYLNPFINALKWKNIINTPIYSLKVKNINNNEFTIAANVFLYNENGQLLEVYVSNNESPFIFQLSSATLIPNTFRKVEAYKYAPNGNRMIEVETEQGITSFYWGHNNSNIIGIFRNLNADALFSNATILEHLNQLKTFTAIESVTTRNSLVSVTNAIISILPNKVEASLLTHVPWGGISSKTTQNGLTTFYQYDLKGRLLRIRDHNFNIIQEYKYNFAKNN